MAKGDLRLEAWGRQAALCSRVPAGCPLEMKQDGGCRGLQWGSGVILRTSTMCGGPGEEPGATGRSLLGDTDVKWGGPEEWRRGPAWGGGKLGPQGEGTEEELA